MDNINDLENSSKEQLVEKVESMQEEIDSLKEENSKAKSNLMWKVRKLEKDKVLIENEKIRLERETKSLRSEVERFRSPPLVLATITEVLDDYRMTVKSSTGPSFLVNYSKFLDEKLLVPGSRVALNQQTFGIVEVLPSEKDANVTGMEIETKPDITYDKIGGLEEQIVEVKETVEEIKAEDKEDLSKKTVAELKEMAKAEGIEGYSKLKKSELLEILNK